MVLVVRLELTYPFEDGLQNRCNCRYATPANDNKNDEPRRLTGAFYQFGCARLREGGTRTHNYPFEITVVLQLSRNFGRSGQFRNDDFHLVGVALSL